MAVKIISLIALSLVVVPSLLYFTGSIELDAVKTAALIGTIGWFVVTPLWMGRRLGVDADKVQI